VDTRLPPPSSRGALILAFVAYFVVKTIVPFGGLMMYPLTLLATWVHEMGHGLTALVVGGHFASLDIYRDAAGLAYTSCAHPWQNGLVAAGGLLAPPIVGAVLLGVSRGPRRARLALVIMAGVVAVSLAVWVRSVAGWIALPIDAIALAYFGIRKSERARMVFAQLIGVMLGMDTLSRVDYLFTAEANIEGVKRTSDIATVASSFGGHYLVWGAMIAALSLALLALGLRLAWRDAPPRSPRPK
jgi:hypothetical protein